MKQVTVIYWSGSGNTRMMAEGIAAGARGAGAAVTLLDVSDASVEQALAGEVLALGCPSMGCEVLEEDVMEPFVAALEKHNLGGKPLGLFGSYDWGDGQWMREWEPRMVSAGALLLTEGLILQNTPDGSGMDLCRQFGVRLAGA